MSWTLQFKIIFFKSKYFIDIRPVFQAGFKPIQRGVGSHEANQVDYRLGADQGEHVEGQEEAVEEVVRQDVVQEFTVDDEDVVQVVQVVQVLCNQVTQLPPVFMPEV